jgi:hypothetical protein
LGSAQRRQIGRERLCLGERSVIAEELKLFVCRDKLLQEQAAEQA